MKDNTSGDIRRESVPRADGPTTILVVEAARGGGSLLEQLAAKGKGLPFAVESADTLQKATKRIGRGDVKVAFVDLDILAGERIDFLAKLLGQVNASPLVILAAREDLVPAIASLQSGAQVDDAGLSSPGVRSSAVPDPRRLPGPDGAL